MDQSKIGVRYAKAFFEVAIEKGLLKEIKNDVDFIASLCNNETVKFISECPVISTQSKKKSFSEIMSGKVNPLSADFVAMVIDNKREKYLPSICRNFTTRYHKLAGIKKAHMTTAVVLDDILKERLRQTIVDLFKTDVELSLCEKPEILGGFVLRVGDQQLDASVATKLKKIKTQFIETSI